MPPKLRGNNGNDEDGLAASIKVMNETMVSQFQNVLQAIQTNATQMGTLQETFNTFKKDIEERVVKVEAGGKAVKEAAAKAEAEEIKKKLEDAGAKVELK